MRTIKNVNVEESIKRNRLVYKDNGLDKTSRVQNYILGLLPFVMAAAFFAKPGFKDEQEFAAGSIVFVIIALFGGFLIYLQANESKLLKVETRFNERENNRLLFAFAGHKGYELCRKEGDYEIFTEQNQYYKWAQNSMVFIVRDRLILFVKLKEGRHNFPPLNSHYELQDELIAWYKSGGVPNA